MLGVLVLAGERHKGSCCDVMFSGFCGLVSARVFGFPHFFGFYGCFPPFSFSFPVLVLILWTFCMLRGVFTLFINFFDYLSIKTLSKNSLNLC
jgi:hypothetical protein